MCLIYLTVENSPKTSSLPINGNQGKLYWSGLEWPAQPLNKRSSKKRIIKCSFSQRDFLFPKSIYSSFRLLKNVIDIKFPAEAIVWKLYLNSILTTYPKYEDDHHLFRACRQPVHSYLTKLQHLDDSNFVLAIFFDILLKLRICYKYQSLITFPVPLGI